MSVWNPAFNPSPVSTSPLPLTGKTVRASGFWDLSQQSAFFSVWVLTPNPCHVEVLRWQLATEDKKERSDELTSSVSMKQSGAPLLPSYSACWEGWVELPLFCTRS